DTVKVDLSDNKIKVTGPKGSLERNLPSTVSVELGEGSLLVKNKEQVETKFGKAIVGTMKSHIANMIQGVQNGWSKKLEINGTGFRGEVQNNNLVLSIGFSHPVTIKAPEGIKFSVEKNIITVEGTDKDTVGQIAAKIKDVRRPDPYKGKGIRYFGEVLKLKPGKQAAKGTA